MIRKIFLFFSIFLIINLIYINLGYTENNWSINPMVIDSTEDKSESYEVTAFEWHPADVSNDIEITDAADTIVWKVRAVTAAANNESNGVEWRHFYTPRYMAGIYISVIDAGTLYIHKTRRSP